jgi:hypothetical protein
MRTACLLLLLLLEVWSSFSSKAVSVNHMYVSGTADWLQSPKTMNLSLKSLNYWCFYFPQQMMHAHIHLTSSYYFTLLKMPFELTCQRCCFFVSGTSLIRSTSYQNLSEKWLSPLIQDTTSLKLQMLLICTRQNSLNVRSCYFRHWCEICPLLLEQICSDLSLRSSLQVDGTNHFIVLPSSSRHMAELTMIKHLVPNGFWELLSCITQTALELTLQWSTQLMSQWNSLVWSRSESRSDQHCIVVL